MNLFKVISSLFQPAADLVDALHTSEDEKLQAKAVLLQLQTSVISNTMDLEKSLLEAKASVIKTEAQADSWLTRTWRPVTMLSLVAAVLGYWFGLAGQNIPLEIIDRMFSLVQLGVGGYIASRGAEKMIPQVITAMKKKEGV